MYKQAKTSISYGKDGDQWEINVGIIGAPTNKTFKFKLGEEYNSQDLDGSPMKSLVSTDGSKIIEKHINEGLQGAEMNIERWIEGDTMM
ncbi:hypothetical protein KUTeg_021417, partial [Tegillarca granosa]